MIKKIFNHFYKDSLYRNSIYLMLSTGVLAFFGFFFWIINTHLFSPSDVGIATTLISITTFISLLSSLGLNNGLIRYLSKSEHKNEKINSTIILTTGITIFLSIAFLIFVSVISSPLIFIRQNLIYIITFILFVVAGTLNNISDSIFIAYRSAGYTLIKNTILSSIRLTLPFLLVGLGAYGLFSSIPLGMIAGIIFATILLFRKFSYHFSPHIYWREINKMAKYSFGNYLITIIGTARDAVIPILIINMISSQVAAYYYIATTISSLLYAIPIAISQSLLAEGSYNETELRTHFKKAALLIFCLMVPAILVTFFWGNIILKVFGDAYSQATFIYIRFLAIAGIFASINCLAAGILSIRHKIKELIFIIILGAGSNLILSILLIHQGLTGIGYAWIIGQLLESIVSIFFVKKYL